jgi:regulator of cell morphogenesis and NO signaling
VFSGGRAFTGKRRCAMATITGEMVINEVIKKYPATIKVFNDYRVDSCCGGGAPIEVTARRDGVDVDGLVRALNAAVEGPQAGSALKR